jgi:flavin reductase (DIM6/NTAB) family NADH-FMN oxidoreductase RutF
LLACLGETSDTGRAIAVGSLFLVNILCEGQEDVARRFAVKDPSKFEAVEWARGLAGLPQIGGVQAAIACEAVELVPGGDHTIVIGQIRSTEIAPGGAPLVHWRRQFGSFGPHEDR